MVDKVKNKTEVLSLGVIRHRKRAARTFALLKEGLFAAAEIQERAAREREEAVAELGERVVTQNFGQMVYRGFLFRDLVEIWATEQDRFFTTRPQPSIGDSKSVPDVRRTPEPPSEDDALGRGELQHDVVQIVGSARRTVHDVVGALDAPFFDLDGDRRTHRRAASLAMRLVHA